ncbi:MAG: ATP-binding cassette domain-containing protein, partial [Candidatus Bathyarchaeia archaeon]
EFKEIVDESNHEKEVKKLLFTYSFAQEGSRAFMTENELILTRSRTSSVYSIDLAIKTAMLYNYGPLEVVKKTAATVRQIMLQWTATPYYERWGETAELVKIEDLSVISDGKYVLKGINMEVKRGEIMGLIGEGSRALILTIAGLYKPTSGSVTIGGIDSYSRREEVKTRIGILLKGTKLYEEFTPRQNLIYLAKLEGKDPKNVVNDILERSALQLYADTKMMDLNPETKRKVMISQLLIRKVSLLLLEDPLDGLKDHEAEGVKSLLMNLSRFEGITIICSGKNYQELDFSDRVAILKKGSIEMMVNKKGESIG